MAIRFVEIKASDNPEALNSEWVILENDGKTAFNTRGCGMTVGRRGSAKKSLLGIIDPGFVLAPGERCAGRALLRASGAPGGLRLLLNRLLELAGPGVHQHASEPVDERAADQHAEHAPEVDLE